MNAHECHECYASVIRAESWELGAGSWEPAFPGVDNIEIPNINTFANFASAGGTVSILDAQLIQDVTFLTGGYPAAYGNRTSSVLQIAQREGNRERVAGRVTLGFAGAGGVAEGPIGRGGRGSWIVSGRRSFLDLFSDDVGIGGVPVLYTVNGKAIYDLTPRDRIWVVNITGIDRIRLGLNEDSDLSDEQPRYPVSRLARRDRRQLAADLRHKGGGPAGRDVLDRVGRAARARPAAERRAAARHAGLDGVLRPGSFDYPVVANLVGGYRLSRKWELSMRASYLRGRPFTPFDAALSTAQRRAVYELGRVNAERTLDYLRIDARVDRTFVVNGKPVSVFFGAQNLTNRENIAGYSWDRRNNLPKSARSSGSSRSWASTGGCRCTPRPSKPFTQEQGGRGVKGGIFQLPFLSASHRPEPRH